MKKNNECELNDKIDVIKEKNNESENKEIKKEV